jgi:hypothetical protein
MDLLFELATWHAFSKLRLHTESTLNALDNSTTRLGQLLRHFACVTCNAYETRELPSEEAAHGRRKAALAAKGQPTKIKAALAAKGQPAKGKEKAKKRLKYLNLDTYKIHALGAYARAIRMYGTTDNYTTQPVSFHILTRGLYLPLSRVN